MMISQEEISVLSGRLESERLVWLERCLKMDHQLRENPTLLNKVEDRIRDDKDCNAIYAIYAKYTVFQMDFSLILHDPRFSDLFWCMVGLIVEVTFQHSGDVKKTLERFLTRDVAFIKLYFCKFYN
jgi:hypothetical protein